MGTASVWLLISMSLSKEHMREVINKYHFTRDFKVSLMAKGMPTSSSCYLHSCLFGQLE